MATYFDTKSISELSGYFFSIPNYQRGYRWDVQQVKDLIDDLLEYSDDPESASRIYCLQPLVLTPTISSSEQVDASRDLEYYKEKNVPLEVIDGQQRLTTIAIILQAIKNEVPYVITYDTLGQNNEKIADVSKISEDDIQKDINLYYIKTAYDYAQERFGDTGIIDKIKNTILKSTKFIVYITDEDKAISIFTRLNVGRIALTGSELIKALFLNRKNYRKSSKQHQDAAQLDIAEQWDQIEAQLQDDQFWLFLREKENQTITTTRIDYLLDFLVKTKDYLCFPDTEVGTDKYRTFRCYYKLYQSKGANFLKYWEDIQKLFDILCEWYNDSELYHYVGYLLELKRITLKDIIIKWEKSNRDEFTKWLLELIRKSICKCTDLDRVYLDKNGGDHKRESIPLLLLHNIVTIVRQNKVISSVSKYNLGVFYKFPFHLYKLESWDVEHIDSATPNELSDIKEQQNWILSTYQCLKEEDKLSLRDEISQYFQSEEDNQQSSEQVVNTITFDSLSKLLLKKLGAQETIHTQEWKNQIMNYTLLDSTTNRTYKNTIFPNKRIHIIGKEKGILKVSVWDSKENIIKEEEVKFRSAFVPPCTKNVFQKTYSTLQGNITQWTIEDANSYKCELQETINYISE